MNVFETVREGKRRGEQERVREKNGNGDNRNTIPKLCFSRLKWKIQNARRMVCRPQPFARCNVDLQNSRSSVAATMHNSKWMAAGKEFSNWMLFGLSIVSSLKRECGDSTQWNRNHGRSKACNAPPQKLINIRVHAFCKFANLHGISLHSSLPDFSFLIHFFSSGHAIFSSSFSSFSRAFLTREWNLNGYLIIPPRDERSWCGRDMAIYCRWPWKVKKKIHEQFQ